MSSHTLHFPSTEGKQCFYSRYNAIVIMSYYAQSKCKCILAVKGMRGISQKNRRVQKYSLLMSRSPLRNIDLLKDDEKAKKKKTRNTRGLIPKLHYYNQKPLKTILRTIRYVNKQCERTVVTNVCFTKAYQMRLKPKRIMKGIHLRVSKNAAVIRLCVPCFEINCW